MSEITCQLNHVAILNSSVLDTAKSLGFHGDYSSSIEIFEETRELYIGEQNLGARLLLMEPATKGHYLSALTRRGPGLHHVAINVPHIQSFVQSLEGSGWLLLPVSLRTWSDIQQVWLARPKVPILVEVIQSSQKYKESFINQIQVPIQEAERGILAHLKCSQILESDSNCTQIEIQGRSIVLEDHIHSRVSI